jgi:hypothetical protein
MRMKSEPDRDDALVDAMLNDNEWQVASAAFKTQAMRAFHGRQRLRRLIRWGTSVLVLAAMITAAVHWSNRVLAPPQQMAMVPAAAPKIPDAPRRLTDEELVAAFPKGSCFIAEVDGKKELVFLDPKVERSYVARAGTGSN